MQYGSQMPSPFLNGLYIWRYIGPSSNSKKDEIVPDYSDFRHFIFPAIRFAWRGDHKFRVHGRTNVRRHYDAKLIHPTGMLRPLYAIHIAIISGFMGK